MTDPDVQAVLFENGYWNTTTARKWLKKNGYTPIKRVHKTANYLRYRITEPEYATYNTKSLLDLHIKLVIGKNSP